MKPYTMRASHIPQGILDFSALQDAPAGKHGFLQARQDGHFYFEDGTRVRFLGVNLVSAGGVPDKDAAPIVAERLARSGVNMVRFHHVDSLSGSLNPQKRSIVDYTQGHSKELCADGVDRLDYMVYELKKRGIYTHIDLFTLRMFLPGDGLDYPDLLEDGFEVALKNIQWFNKRIIQLHKVYIQQYLTHYNPYTKTRYVDEPAVAIVQLLNENSIFWDNRKAARAFPSYREELDRKWNQYLLDTYGNRANLDAAWTNDRGEKALLPYEDPAMGTVLSPGLGFWNELQSEYDAPFKGEKSPVRVAEHKKFLTGLATDYVTEMTGYLRSLGVKCCVDVSNIPLGTAELAVVAQGDLTEKNTYWNHPQRDQEEKAAHSVFHQMYTYNSSPLPKYPGRFQSFKLNMIASNSFGKVAGKPMVITEWNVPHPTLFRPDVVLQMACYGALQDWDGMLLFEYWGAGTKESLHNDHIAGMFTSCNDPAVWGLMNLSAAIFRQGLVQTAKNVIDVGFSEVDRYHQPDFLVPYRVAPFFCRVQARFFEEKYDGDADLAIASGYTASGDYTGAKHSLIYSRSPYSDFYQKERGVEAYLSKHEEAGNSYVFRDGRAVDTDEQAFYRQFRKAAQQFGLAGPFTLEDDEPMVSDTKQLCYDYKGGKMTVDTPQFNAYVGDGGTHTVGGVRYSIENGRMCVSLLARDGKALCDSRHILLTAIGDCANSGIAWQGDELLSEGHAPILIDPFKGAVCFASSAESCAAYALNDKGERVEKLSVQRIQDGFSVDCAAQTPAMYFELELEG